jgi:peroxiredoxin
MTHHGASKGERVAVVLQTLALAAAATLGLPVAAAVSGGGDPVPTHPTLAGQTASGQTISLNALRGQVVLVMVWSTDCSVCLSKMPELRANLAGWHTKGFQIISINTDARPDPLRSWEAARLVTVPPSQQWPSLWKGAPGFATSLTLDAPNATGATHLPSIYVLDRAGKLRMHTTGRVPAEVWDTIAELL